MLSCVAEYLLKYLYQAYFRVLSWAGPLAATVGLVGSTYSCGGSPGQPRDPMAGALPQGGPCEAGPGLQPMLAKECSCPAITALLRAASLSLNVSDLFSVVQRHWLLELPSALLAV